MYKQYEKAPKYKDFRKMLDKEDKNIDAVHRHHSGSHARHRRACGCMERGKHVYVQKPLVRTIWEARMLTEAAAKYKVATQMGNQGYSNEGTRQCAEMIWSGEIGNVTEVHAWTDRPIWPQGLTEIPTGDAGAGHARLGPLAGRRGDASVHRRRRGLSEQLRRILLSAVQLARLLRFRLRRARRHGLPHSRRAEHGAEAGRAHQRRVHQEGRHQQLHVPEEVDHPVRLPGSRHHARREALLVRRSEAAAQDRRRSRRRAARRYPPAATASAGWAGPAAAAAAASAAAHRLRRDAVYNPERAVRDRARTTAACSSATRA